MQVVYSLSNTPQGLRIPWSSNHFSNGVPGAYIIAYCFLTANITARICRCACNKFKTLLKWLLQNFNRPLNWPLLSQRSLLIASLIFLQTLMIPFASLEWLLPLAINTRIFVVRRQRVKRCTREHEANRACTGQHAISIFDLKTNKQQNASCKHHSDRTSEIWRRDMSFLWKCTQRSIAWVIGMVQARYSKNCKTMRVCFLQPGFCDADKLSYWTKILSTRAVVHEWVCQTFFSLINYLWRRF